jgi:hypothetical protein
MAAEELDAWRSSGDASPEGLPGRATPETIEEPGPDVDTEPPRAEAP